MEDLDWRIQSLNIRMNVVAGDVAPFIGNHFLLFSAVISQFSTFVLFTRRTQTDRIYGQIIHHLAQHVSI